MMLELRRAVVFTGGPEAMSRFYATLRSPTAPRLASAARTAATVFDMRDGEDPDGDRFPISSRR